MVNRSGAWPTVRSRRLLKKAFEATFSILDGALASAQAPFYLLLSVSAQGTDSLQYPAPYLIQCPFDLSRSLLFITYLPFLVIPIL